MYVCTNVFGCQQSHWSGSREQILLSAMHRQVPHYLDKLIILSSHEYHLPQTCKHPHSSHNWKYHQREVIEDA